jgi:hypothetical protein
VLNITWCEVDGPAVSAPVKFNFGSKLITSMLKQIGAELRSRRLTKLVIATEYRSRMLFHGSRPTAVLPERSGALPIEYRLFGGGFAYLPR